MEFPICIGSESGSQNWQDYKYDLPCSVTTPHDHNHKYQNFSSSKVGMPEVVREKEKDSTVVTNIHVYIYMPVQDNGPPET